MGVLSGRPVEIPVYEIQYTVTCHGAGICGKRYVNRLVIDCIVFSTGEGCLE